MCVPGQQPDFDEIVTERPVAEGTMQRLGARRVGARMVYRYRALLAFERFERNQFIPIDAADVDKLLHPGAATACKVRILVYLAPRYFSETLQLPNDAVKRLARQLARDAATPAGQAGLQ